MKTDVIIIIILLLVILSSIFYQTYFDIQIDGFDTINNVDCYVISIGNEERLRNIQQQNKKLKSQNSKDTNTNIKIIDAVVGKNLDLNELTKKGLLSPEFTDTDKNAKIKNAIGCYLSHLKIYDIVSTTKSKGYSIIFEDDFIINDDFYKKMTDAIKKIENNHIDFDMLFLGVLNNNDREEPVVDNIEKCSIIYAGCHGYLINNKNANKIKSKLEYMQQPIDHSIFIKNINNELIVYKLKDSIVFQNGMQSSIR